MHVHQFYWGYMGIMEKKMETTIVYWGYMGIMEKKMETTIVYLDGFYCLPPSSRRCTSIRSKLNNAEGIPGDGKTAFKHDQSAMIEQRAFLWEDLPSTFSLTRSKNNTGWYLGG